MGRRSKNKSRSEDALASPEAASAAAVDPSPVDTIAEPQHTQPTEPATPWWKNDWLIALLFFAATFLAYSHIFNGAFVWDDDAYISQNPWMRSLKGLHNIWFNPTGSGHQYYPLTFTVFWATFQIWKLNPVPYHLIDIGFHALTSVLLWQVLKRLKTPGALLAGALFALYPVNVMSAGWMNELKNTFSGSLALLSIWAYIRFEGLGVYEKTAPAPKRNWNWYTAAIILFLLAMLAKTAVSFLPVTVLLLVWWKREKFGWKEIWPALPMVGVVAGMGLMTIYFEKHVSGATGDGFKLSFLERLIISGHSFFFYIGKMLLPVHLSFIYTRWNIDTHDPFQYLWPLAVVAVLAGLWLARRRIGKAPFAVAVHFYISTSFLVLMVVLYRMRYSFVADHWIYFGSMSVFALMGAAFARGLDWLAKRGIPHGPWAQGALLATLGAMTWHQCYMFHDFETHDPFQYLWPLAVAAVLTGLWLARRFIDKAPFAAAMLFYINTSLLIFMVVLYRMRYSFVADHWIYFGSMSVFALMGAAFARGLDWLAKRGIPYGPWAIGALLVTLGAMTWHQCYMFHDFETLWSWTIAESPDCWMAENNLGNALSENGHVKEALGHFQKALAIKPDYPLAMNNYGSALLKLKRYDEAVALFNASDKLKPNNLDTLNNLGYACLVQNHYEDAIGYYRRALAIAPPTPDMQAAVNSKTALVRNNLSQAYQLEGRYVEAIAFDRDTLKLFPDDAVCYNHLARMLATCPEYVSRDGIQAEAYAKRAIALEPGTPIPYNTLAAAYAEQGRFHDAIAADLKAIDVATKVKNFPLVNAFKKHLAIFEQSKPLREK
ncbi:MAG TPA: tetratricopeptide repeat protein [Chthoniobacteraceae bacterium]|nr:tetratricopeptide repeat protein [Chthoniobacteraceae bacterium]